jgi:hypothetical protein
LAEFLLRQAWITNNTAHRKCINGIMPRDGQDTHTVRHDDMATLPYDAETSLFNSLHCTRMRNSGDLAHSSGRDFDVAKVAHSRKLPR